MTNNLFVTYVTDQAFYPDLNMVDLNKEIKRSNLFKDTKIG